MKEISRYQVGKNILVYYQNITGGCEWIIVPEDKAAFIELPRKTKYDSLVQVKLVGDDFPKGFVNGSTMRNSETVMQLKYLNQENYEYEKYLKIVTLLSDHHGNYYEHCAIGDKTFGIIETFVKFKNQSNKDQTLEMLSSFSLSNISPFNAMNKTGNLQITRYRSKWSFEGRKEKQPIEEYQLEPSWKPSGVGLEKFGQVGSMPVRNYFPVAAITDVTENVTWGIRLANPGSWQGEFYRLDEDLCFSGGIADRDYGNWYKILKSGESFETPHAFLTVCEGSEEDCGNQFNQYFSRLVSGNAHMTEEKMAIIFNEFCTTWGKPSEKSVTETLAILKKYELDYYVIDCGWYADPVKGWEKNMGDWIPNAEQFPNGIKSAIQKIKDAGMVPGIWFEIETIGRDAIVFSEKNHLLKKDGVPITAGDRRFWDMNDPWVINYLSKKIINFLKTMEIGYLKIDYNDNFGVGFDGVESLGEENRKQLIGTQRFFDKIHSEIPEIIIENCSSGGHRLEPSMMMRTDLSSFSDAHESLCIPIIGANMQELIPSRQNLMWVVLRKKDSIARIYYSMTAVFLGRLCLSGDITALSDKQWQALNDGITLYKTVSSIIKTGYSYRYGMPILSYRDPIGEQAIVRYNNDKSEALIILHGFKDAKGLEIPIESEFEIVTQYGSMIQITKTKSGYFFRFTSDFQGVVFYLKKKIKDGCQ